MIRKFKTLLNIDKYLTEEIKNKTKIFKKGKALWQRMNAGFNPI